MRNPQFSVSGKRPIASTTIQARPSVSTQSGDAWQQPAPRPQNRFCLTVASRGTWGIISSSRQPRWPDGRHHIIYAINLEESYTPGACHCTKPSAAKWSSSLILPTAGPPFFLSDTVTTSHQLSSVKVSDAPQGGWMEYITTQTNGAPWALLTKTKQTVMKYTKYKYKNCYPVTNRFKGTQLLIHRSFKLGCCPT